MFRVGLGLVAVLLSASFCSAAAEPVPSDVAPPLSFCLGETYHCVLLDLNLQSVNYDLSTKKWQSGVKTLSAGYVLMFYSNEPWGFGPALHGEGQWSQGEPSSFGLTATGVFFRYFEVGVTFVLLDGKIDKYLTLGLSANLEHLTRILTGKSMLVRLEEERTRRLAASGAGK